jgi:hypothetical protein
LEVFAQVGQRVNGNGDPKRPILSLRARNRLFSTFNPLIAFSDGFLPIHFYLILLWFHTEGGENMGCREIPITPPKRNSTSWLINMWQHPLNRQEIQ